MVKKIIHLFENIRNFGLKFSINNLLRSIFPRGKHFDDRYRKSILSFFHSFLSDEIEKYNNIKITPDITEKDTDKKIPIWILWLQGFDKAPDLVQLCVRSLEKNLPHSISEIRYITEDNIADYVELPEFILEKYHSGIITRTHFSDLLRFYLISCYGGMWIDASSYATDCIPKEYIDTDLFTIKVYEPQNYRAPSYARWCAGCWAGRKDGVFFQFMKEALTKYWQCYDYDISFVLVDYIIATAYENIPIIRKMFDELPPNTKDIHLFMHTLFEPFENESYKNLCNNSVLHMISSRIPTMTTTPDGKKTLYAFLLEKMDKESNK